jgi:hypothetical protein
MATLKLNFKDKGNSSAIEPAPLSVPASNEKHTWQASEPDTSREHFWFVWNCKKRRPKKRHPTPEMAFDEAARLESLNPGQEYFVFETTRVHPPSNAQGRATTRAL